MGWNFLRLALGAGYAYLWPGRFIEESGPSRGIDFAWVWASFTF